MNRIFRDNVVLKNRVLLNLTLAWAFSATFAVIILGGLCFYVVKHKETHWLPICTEEGYFLGNASYSPSYIKDMTKKVIQLRLTYNPETVESRFATLVHLIPASHQEAFKKILDSEIGVVKEKNISSVFYEKDIEIDPSNVQAKIKGTLNRTSHGLEVKPQAKVYLVQFSYKQGMMWPMSIQEVHS
ncbi:putative conjugative transfer protein TraE [Legionella quinlivanii]|uniref:Putative conjugative transfer protein TraE n=1 Tax=Legionella quinlivanii TaxID=45073 RepID=A0A0W0XSS0_9GAMM|nr:MULTISPECIES: TraE/TraK family type IV conjugative transfer system protein [Legionella]KTD47440.1 putative conjugative transfer protein TraE [Legionella quinlivanii]MCE3043683.1 type IV conjugative transfer system protein TraE [Legionella sp. 16cNR16C]SEG46360.1 conjugal transfer pilus assembly protein TraE [Legionella quinlivanii DSM 21216]STY49839.1 putative conjugative transfer protein TraE [Legionella quinlivanii]